MIQEMIERYVSWNDEIGDWELKCIAYTGNNMRKRDQHEIDHDAAIKVSIISILRSFDSLVAAGGARSEWRLLVICDRSRRTSRSQWHGFTTKDSSQVGQKVGSFLMICARPILSSPFCRDRNAAKLKALLQ